MHNQAFSKIWIVIILVVLITGGILTWQYFSTPKEEAKIVGEEKLPLSSNIAECSKSSIPSEQIITGSFRSADEFTSAGEATLSGRVVTRGKKYFEEEVEKVYLEIAPQNGNTPQANFYSYFIRMVEEGNTVNTVNLREDDNLLFSIGELTDNGNAFSSTADISPLAKIKILSVLKTAEIISLRMQVPVWVGMGATSNFSFACAVEFSED